MKCCFYEESLPQANNYVWEISQNLERALAMEVVVIDITDDEEDEVSTHHSKIKGTNSDFCICLGEFDKQQDENTCEDELIFPACCHRFHVACIIPWLVTKNRTCPLCHTHFSTIVTYTRVDQDLIK